MDIPDFQENLQTLLGNIEDVFPEKQSLLTWDDNSASVGSLPYSCPCIPVGYAHADSSKCAISRIVCTIQDSVPELKDSCDTSDLNRDFIEYDAMLAPRIRSVLRTPQYAEVLREKDFICPMFLPSSLWKFDATASGILLHGASGVTATNLDFVKENIGKVLGEDHRVLDFAKLSTPGCDTTNATDAENLAFPAAHVVAVSPAVVACVRYVVDTVWVHSLLASGVNFEHVQEANATAQVWRTRCEAKANKLESCRRFGTFDKKVQSNAHSQCPYEVKNDGQDFHILHTACLVRKGEDFFDPFKCKVCTSEQLCTIESFELIDDCQIASPLRILRNIKDTKHARGIPSLSHGFVDDVMRRSDDAVRGMLFPETGANLRKWFRVPYDEYSTLDSKSLRRTIW